MIHHFIGFAYFLRDEKPDYTFFCKIRKSTETENIGLFFEAIHGRIEKEYDS
jgi:hypothetical protein